MFVDQDTDTKTCSGTLSLYSMTVAMSFAFGGDFMIASPLANDKGTHRSVGIAERYSLRICYANETCQLSHFGLYILLNHQDR